MSQQAKRDMMRQVQFLGKEAIAMRKAFWAQTPASLKVRSAQSDHAMKLCQGIVRLRARGY